jgi:hypothetical protein
MERAEANSHLKSLDLVSEVPRARSMLCNSLCSSETIVFMKNLFVPSIALLLGLSVPSFARIGETMDQAIKRYGPVVDHDTIQGETLDMFKKNGFVVIVHFHDGKIDHILYGKETRDKLTPEEINTFLKANNGGRPMKEDFLYLWVGKDVIATYSKDVRHWHLNIETKDYEHRQIAARKAKEKSRQEAEKAKLKEF